MRTNYTTLLHTLIVLPRRFPICSSSSGSFWGRATRPRPGLGSFTSCTCKDKNRVSKKAVVQGRALLGSSGENTCILRHFPRGRLRTSPATDFLLAPSPQDDALLSSASGWMTHLGPVTHKDLGDLLGVPATKRSNRPCFAWKPAEPYFAGQIYR